MAARDIRVVKAVQTYPTLSLPFERKGGDPPMRRAQSVYGGENGCRGGALALDGRPLHDGGKTRQASFETVGFANRLRMKLLDFQ